MRINLLGPLELQEEDLTLDIPGEKLRTIVATLALTPGQGVSRDDLIDELWGELPPHNAANSLQGHVVRLRRLLAERSGKPWMRDILRTSRSGYLIDAQAVAVDAVHFCALVDEAAGLTGAPERTAAKLRQALALWRGPALVDAGQGMICRIAYAGLEATRMIAREQLIDAQLALGQHRLLVPELERLHSQFPLQERFCEQLMTALYRCGQQADALNVYQQIRQRLGRELGLEPGPGLQAQLQQILQPIHRAA
ncbi:AfsR/SARP family transcriptional regulator [Kitasatospora sp. MAA4]|uniref:AfsR/SARP family transcriptional regulator n=1 Tax=Kitasatospora sp. MAA4 TaxID=3035093 RepID=UPI002476653D|nr:AfsR/SARP family transcriptional regulator [Kitasatospora sp. MAA4]